MRQPRWLDASGAEVDRLNAVSLAIDLSVKDLPKATLVLPSGEQAPGIHGFVELYTPRGSAGIFRVVSISFTQGDTRTLQLMGAADTLSDDIYPDSADEDLTKTPSQWLSYLLAEQTATHWQAGTCDSTTSVKMRPNYQSLWTLLENLRTAEPDLTWVYDYTTTPWTLNLKRMGSSTVSGFRLTRNVTSAQVSITDSEMCNELWFTLSPNTGSPTLEIYDNLASQALYGTRMKCATVKEDELPVGMTGAQYAQRILSERAQPQISFTIDGLDLAHLTGDDYDKITLGSLCAVTIPEWSATPINERVMGLSWPDVIGEPERIKASLSNILSPFTENLALAKKIAGGVRGSAARAPEDLSSWSKVVTDTIEAADGTGIVQMWQSGIDMTAQGGVKIFSLAQGYNSIYSNLTVQAGLIDLVVNSEGSTAEIRIDAIVDGINGSQVSIDADHIKLTGGNIYLNEVIVIDNYGAAAYLDYMEVTNAQINELTVPVEIDATTGQFDSLYVEDTGGAYTQATWQSATVVTSVTANATPTVKLEKVGGGNWDGTVVSSVSKTTDTIYYLGRTV